MFDSVHVIYNPAAGRGHAARSLASWHTRLPPGAVLHASQRPGHGRELAKRASDGGATLILAAGGDGTMHEVVNGLLDSGRTDVVFAPLPLGSMNDYAHSLGMSAWWKAQAAWDTLIPRRVDIGVIRSGERLARFANGCGIGFNGMVTIEARKIRRLRGIPLYATAVLKALWRHYAAPPMTITFDATQFVKPTLAMTLGIAHREGGFPLTKNAVLDDGLFDILHVSDVARWELIRHLPGMITGNLPTGHAKLSLGRAAAVMVTSPVPLCVHVDGEFFCTPEEHICEIEMTLESQRLTVATWTPPR